MLYKDESEFDNDPNIKRARQFGFEFDYDTYKKAMAWWNILNLQQQLEYEADYRMSMPENVTLKFANEDIKIYVLYECYAEDSS